MATPMNGTSVPDLLFGDKLDEFWELTASTSVDTLYTLSISRNAMQLQRNVVLGISAHHQHAALQSPNMRSKHFELYENKN